MSTHFCGSSYRQAVVDDLISEFTPRNISATISSRRYPLSEAASSSVCCEGSKTLPRSAAIIRTSVRPRNQKFTAADVKTVKPAGEQVSMDALMAALQGLRDVKSGSVAAEKIHKLAEESKAGDPLGKKYLGKKAAKWLQDGFDAFSAEIMAQEAEESGSSLLRLSSSELMEAARSTLKKIGFPPGSEEKCQVAMRHYPTMWDNFQRSLRAKLMSAQQQDETNPGGWKETATWQKVKQLAQSGEHRKATMSTTPKVKPNSARQVAAQDSSMDDAHFRINVYVAKALELLKLEREEEVKSLLGPKSTKVNPSDDVADPPRVEPPPDSLRNMKAVSFTSGLRGTTLVTLQPMNASRKVASPFGPGEAVCVRVDGPGGAPSLVLVSGTVHSVGGDGGGLVVASEVGFDPRVSKLSGVRLRVERINALADATTYKRNCEALIRLKKSGLLRKNPSFKIVGTLFGNPIPVGSFQEVSSGVGEAGGEDSWQGLKMDAYQQRAVDSALSKKVPVTVVQGPPGTGKTKVLREIIRRSVLRGDRVLAVAPTNTAVDSLAELLHQSGVSVVRLGNPARLADEVTELSLDAQVEARLAKPRAEFVRRRADLRQDLRQVAGDDTLEAGISEILKSLVRSFRQMEKEAVDSVLLSAQVVLATTTGAGDPALSRQKHFDLVVMDEAGQATEPSSWIPLLLGKRALLAGDICQLAPTILSQEALAGGLGVSLMERAVNLARSQAPAPESSSEGAAESSSSSSSSIHVTMLRMQYRMNAAIADWCSAEMYQGLLLSAPAVSSRLLADSPSVQSMWWTRTPLLLLDTRLPRGSLLDGCQEQVDQLGSKSLVNEGEADIVVRYVSQLVAAGVSPSAIAVQSPYLAQVQLLQSRLEDIPECSQVEVASIDSFQGREADAVIISMVRSNPTGAVGFVSDRRRMNVAVTRARMHVAIVCDSATVSYNPFLKRLLHHIRRKGLLRCAATVLQNQLPGVGNVTVGYKQEQVVATNIGMEKITKPSQLVPNYVVNA